MSKVSQAQRLRDLLEDAIIKGRYPPGARLDPEALEREYDCSRTPVREAIQQLAMSGMVKVVPKRGTFVTKLSVAELVERFEVMAELEGMCARLAARRIGSEELAALREAHEACRRMAEAGDANGYYYENSIFHQRIYEASHNAFLAQEATRLHAVLQPYRRMQLHLRHRPERSLAEHEAVLAAIAAGDEQRAEAEIEAHVQIQGERFNDLVASVQQLQQTGSD
ncbi:GntR family transcriptional regulator [Chromohalobacter israelensis]|uniref:GntR family transcriptional regulator n=1 Tax=Chromohalobacter israelensis TaxID=141390 RepID=UPI000D70B4E0|nr:GntR family transcriptional regulator [Chromohalobacter salexigens]MDO0947121.1 GntR family transcriptional regulator [Chromohalobacter salexigens]PWW31567.1 GntR family transcriptional regulator [Chromohalobacter salexigens]